MKTFSVKFKTGSLDLDVIVTVSDRHQKFKVEMITGEPDPIILKHSATEGWSVENPGQRMLTEEQFQELQKVIGEHLYRLYGAGKILVLTDFSEAALNAAKYAAGLTQQLGSSALVIYHSYNHLPVVTGNFAPASPEFIHNEEETQRKLNQLKKELQELVSKDTSIDIVTDGRPLISAVNMITEQQHIGLVVMGMAGKSALEKVLIGSNTVNVARESATALLVVPLKATYKPIENVVFACDLKNVSKTIPVYQINAFIRQLKTKLSILYVNKAEEHEHAGARTELDNLHQIWDQKEVKYHYTDHENIEDGILDFADEHTMDLLITVPKAYGFFERLFHRSLTKNLAYRTHIPLLVFRENT